MSIISVKSVQCCMYVYYTANNGIGLTLQLKSLEEQEQWKLLFQSARGDCDGDVADVDMDDKEK